MYELIDTSDSTFKVDNIGICRRIGIDRREFSFTAYVPERRTGKDRRRSEKRRQGLVTQPEENA